MFFSNDNQNFVEVVEKTFTKSIEKAASMLKISPGHKIYHKAEKDDTVFCFIYMGK